MWCESWDWFPELNDGHLKDVNYNSKYFSNKYLFANLEYHYVHEENEEGNKQGSRSFPVIGASEGDTTER